MAVDAVIILEGHSALAVRRSCSWSRCWSVLRNCSCLVHHNLGRIGSWYSRTVNAQNQFNPDVADLAGLINLDPVQVVGAILPGNRGCSESNYFEFCPIWQRDD